MDVGEFLKLSARQEHNQNIMNENNPHFDNTKYNHKKACADAMERIRIARERGEL